MKVRVRNWYLRVELTVTSESGMYLNSTRTRSTPKPVAEPTALASGMTVSKSHIGASIIIIFQIWWSLWKLITKCKFGTLKKLLRRQRDMNIRMRTSVRKISLKVRSLQRSLNSRWMIRNQTLPVQAGSQRTQICLQLLMSHLMWSSLTTSLERPSKLPYFMIARLNLHPLSHAWLPMNSSP